MARKRAASTKPTAKGKAAKAAATPSAASAGSAAGGGVPLEASDSMIELAAMVAEKVDMKIKRAMIRVICPLCLPQYSMIN